MSLAPRAPSGSGTRTSLSTRSRDNLHEHHPIPSASRVGLALRAGRSDPLQSTRCFESGCRHDRMSDEQKHSPVTPLCPCSEPPSFSARFQSASIPESPLQTQTRPSICSRSEPTGTKCVQPARKSPQQSEFLEAPTSLAQPQFASSVTAKQQVPIDAQSCRNTHLEKILVRAAVRPLSGCSSMRRGQLARATDGEPFSSAWAAKRSSSVPRTSAFVSRSSSRKLSWGQVSPDETRYAFQKNCQYGRLG